MGFKGLQWCHSGQIKGPLHAVNTVMFKGFQKSDVDLKLVLNKQILFEKFHLLMELNGRFFVFTMQIDQIRLIIYV